MYFDGKEVIVKKKRFQELGLFLGRGEWVLLWEEAPKTVTKGRTGTEFSQAFQAD